jgi:hypothetical protein
MPRNQDEIDRLEADWREKEELSRQIQESNPEAMQEIEQAKKVAEEARKRYEDALNAP